MVSNRPFYAGAAALAVAVTSACFVTAQDAKVQQVPQAQPVANDGTAANSATYRAKQLIGSKLAIQGNASAGTIDDIVLDEHGNVDYLIVATADGQLVSVPWDAAVYNADKRVATVQITPENFKQVPTYTAQQYPVYSTPAYRTQTYKYYGLTPGQARRAVRRTLP
ncbi:MAG TPA: PRC-barrel domain-containing protein [Schlesneria sp.]|jgi:hypothetical protein